MASSFTRVLVLIPKKLLIGLHIWAAMESYEVLGVFGMYLGFIRRWLLSRYAQDGSMEIFLRKTSQLIWNTLAFSGENFPESVLTIR